MLLYVLVSTARPGNPVNSISDTCATPPRELLKPSAPSRAWQNWVSSATSLIWNNNRLPIIERIGELVDIPMILRAWLFTGSVSFTAAKTVTNITLLTGGKKKQIRNFRDCSACELDWYWRKEVKRLVPDEDVEEPHTSQTLRLAIEESSLFKCENHQYEPVQRRG